MENKIEPWEKTLINMSDAIMTHPELPMGKAISLEQAKATWPIAFEAGQKSRDAKILAELKRIEVLAGPYEAYTTRLIQDLIRRMEKAK